MEEKKFDPAKMIESAFDSDPMEGHPLAFIREKKFRDLVDSLTAVYEENSCDTREVICSVVELLMRTTPYTSGDSKTTLLASRSTPIMRQLIFEHKSAAEIMVIISTMLTSLALYSSEK